MDRHELAALKTKRLETQHAANRAAVSKGNPSRSTEAQQTVARAAWLKPLGSYTRRERCEFQVTRFG
jgi:hypothetical protein